MVRPTSHSLSEQTGKWTEAQLRQAISDWELQFRGKPKLIKDTELSEHHIKNSNLILWGDTASNSAIAKIIDQLPLQWTHSTLSLGHAEVGANSHVPVLIFPNPLNPNRYVVLNSGFTFSRFGHMSNATQTPKLPDWALVDITKPYNAGDPECIVAAGFFDERWRPKSAN